MREAIGVVFSRFAEMQSIRQVFLSLRAEHGEITLTEAARMLDLSPMTALRQLRAGTFPAEQYCKGAPWVIKRRDIKDQQRVERAKTGRKDPPSSAAAQQPSVFQQCRQMGIMTYDQARLWPWRMPPAWTTLHGSAAPATWAPTSALRRGGSQSGEMDWSGDISNAMSC